MSLILALARKIVFTTDRVRGGTWSTDPLIPIKRLSECTLGIVGLGRIGSTVATRALPFFKQVIAADPYIPEICFGDNCVQQATHEEVYEEADFVTLHVPLTEETHHLINAEVFARMKPAAYLINTSRGAVVDTEALVAALREGRLAGAGLDVHEQEPLPRDHPLRSFPQVILTPHAAFYSEEAVAEVRRDTCVNVVRVLKGEAPINRVV